jgi:hypothetical protein
MAPAVLAAALCQIQTPPPLRREKGGQAAGSTECPAFMRDLRCARTTGLRCRALDPNTIAISKSHVHRIEAAKVKAVAVQLLGGSDLKWPDEQKGVSCSIS